MQLTEEEVKVIYQAETGEKTGVCPNCERMVSSVWNTKRCGYCGMKLDWYPADHVVRLTASRGW